MFLYFLFALLVFLSGLKGGKKKNGIEKNLIFLIIVPC